jgi:hypothetical protein
MRGRRGLQKWRGGLRLEALLTEQVEELGTRDEALDDVQT